MRSIQIENPVLDRTYKTRLGVDYASGTTPTVENTASFATNDYLVFGEPGEELTEGKQLNTISGSTGLLLNSGLNFAHAKGTSVYKAPWDFVSIERATSANGPFSQITQSGIQWDNPNNFTIYFDTTGADSYNYRFRFYNSVLAIYSEYSPTLAGIGFTRNQVGYMIEQVRMIVNDQQRKIVTDDEIIRFFNRAQDIIYAHNPTYWFLLVDVYQQANGVPCTANSNVYSLAQYTNYGHLASVRYNYNPSAGVNQLFPLLRKGTLEFDNIAMDVNRTADDNAWVYKLLPADANSANGYIQIFPKTKNTGVGTLYPNYYDKMTNLNSVDDVTQVPLPNILEDFAIGQVERVKGNEAKAGLYEIGLLGTTLQRSGRILTIEPQSLIMLDKLDQSTREVQGQPRSLWNFKGQKAMTQLFSNRRPNRDYQREFYFDP